MVTFIAQPFMGIVIFVLYFQSAYIHSHIAVFYIYTIFTFLTLYFSLCIRSLYEAIKSQDEKSIEQRLPWQEMINLEYKDKINCRKIFLRNSNKFVIELLMNNVLSFEQGLERI